MENQNLKEDLERKINSFKAKYEGKLSEKQKGLFESLLFNQGQIIRLEGKKSSMLISPCQGQLTRAKKSLTTTLSKEEVENICQLQIELTKIEMELESQLEVKTEVLF